MRIPTTNFFVAILLGTSTLVDVAGAMPVPSNADGTNTALKVTGGFLLGAATAGTALSTKGGQRWVRNNGIAYREGRYGPLPEPGSGWKGVRKNFLESLARAREKIKLADAGIAV